MEDFHDYSTFGGKIQWILSRIRWQHVLTALGIASVVAALTFIGFALSLGKPEPATPVLKSTGNMLKAPAGNSAEERLILIDTDAGIDDAWAIFLLLQAHKNPDIPLRIVAITTTFGNTGVNNVDVNVARILQAADEENIPVFHGSESALVLPLHLNYTRFVGLDGFGDAGLPKIQPNLRKEHAALGIIQFAEEYAGRLEIAAIGPVTNLATAVRLKPGIRQMLKSITIMGGNYKGKQDESREGTRADFNFLSDVEAAYIVLGNFAPTPVVLVPHEAIKLGKTNCTYRRDSLGSLGTPVISLLNRIESFGLKKCTEYWYAPDAVAAAILLQPSVSLLSESIYATVELRGDARGQVFSVGKSSKTLQSPLLQVTTAVDVDLFRRMLVWAAGGPFYTEQPE